MQFKPTALKIILTLLTCGICWFSINMLILEKYRANQIFNFRPGYISDCLYDEISKMPKKCEVYGGKQKNAAAISFGIAFALSAGVYVTLSIFKNKN